MKIFQIEANLNVRHLYVVEAETKEEAKSFIEEKERCKGESKDRAHVKDKVWLGNISNQAIEIKEIWEE